MKKISLLQKPPVAHVNLPSMPFIANPDPLLKTLLDSEPPNPKQLVADGFLKILDGQSSQDSKLEAIKVLTELVEKDKFFDSRVVPTFLKCYKSQDSELSEAALNGLVKTTKHLSTNDDELMLFFHGLLNKRNSTQALHGLRALLNRRTNPTPGLISSVISSFKQTDSFTHEAAALSVISAYLAEKQTGGVDNFRTLAELPNGKEHSNRTVIIEDGKPVSIQNFIETVIKNNSPELESLIVVKNDVLFFTTATIRSEALYRLSELIENEATDDPNLLPVLTRSSTAKENAIRINSIACAGALVSNPKELNAGALTLLRSSVSDVNDQVRANTFHAMQLLTQRSGVLADELQPHFIANLRSEKDPETVSYTLQGVVSLLEQRLKFDPQLSDLLIQYAADKNTLPKVKAISLFALAKHLELTPINNTKLSSVLVDCAKSDDVNTKANALLAIANNLKWEITPELSNLLVTNISDQHSEVRASALLGVKNYLEKASIVAPNLEQLIRNNFHDKDKSVRTNALYAYGNAFNRLPVCELQPSDLEILLHIASRDTYEPARAATYALSVIVNKDISKLDKVEYEDRIEILCKIFGGCLPEENDNYDKSIKSALNILEQRFNLWKKAAAQVSAPQPAALKRFLIRDELHKSAIEQISLRANDLYRELLAAGEAIKSLEAENLSLEFKLQKEKSHYLAEVILDI